MRIRYTIAIFTVAGLLAGWTAPGNATPAGKNTTGTTTAAKSNSKSTASTSASRKRAAKARRVRAPRAQMAPTLDRISEIQAKLAASGFYQGEGNGKWDEATIAAMRGFQSSHGLNPTGKLDALTLQKMGLGSDTAGRGAPRPQPEASAISNSEAQRP